MNNYNSTFSFKRFKNLFLRDLFVNLRPLITIVGGIFFIFLLIFSLILLINHSSDKLMNIAQNFYNVTYFMAFLAGSLFFSGNAFRDFRNKERSMSYLMLPSSNLEKVLSQYILVTFIFTIFTTLAYYIFSFFSMTLISVFTDYTLSFYEPFGKVNWNIFFRTFILAQLFLLAGAVTFRRSPLFFTGLTYFLYFLALSLIIAAFVTFIFSGIGTSSVDTALESTGFLNTTKYNSFWELDSSIFNSWSLKAFYYYHQYIIGVGFALYIWFKVKEKQA